MTRAGAIARRTHFALCAVIALAGCRNSGFVAELIRTQASVERDFGRAPEVWSTAKTGDRFELGDGLRTGMTAEATLNLPRRARLLIKSDTVVRFKRSLDSASPAEQIEMQRGELTIDTGALDLGLRTSRGVVKLMRETTVRMRAEPEKTRFDVVVGRVEYSVDGTSRSVPAGGGFELEVLKASAEPQAPFAATAPPSTEPEANAKRDTEPKTGEDRPEAEGGKRALANMSFQDSPPSAIVTLPAGESAVIHDPAPPSDVRMTFTQCSEVAVLELDRGNGRFDALRVRGSGEVRARIPRGAFKYRMRCSRGAHLPTTPFALGRISIVADAATRPLPLAPVTITAEADGRRYTVSYQNRLPVITLRWSDAPRAKLYRLSVRPEQGALISLESNRSSITLPPGKVGEGLHQFWFETDDKKRSEQGQLQVSFDYAARTAYLTSPVDGESAQSGHARFAGGTLIGSSVQAGGIQLKLDAQGRFASSLEIPAEAGGAFVRVQHRSTGIHYYVRHLR